MNSRSNETCQPTPVGRLDFFLLFSLVSAAAVAADRQALTTNVPVIVTSNSYLVRTVVTNDGWIIGRYRYRTSETNWEEGETRTIVLPYTFKDVGSGTTILVESDGRHVTATSPDGQVLWRRDPFADAHLEYYRTRTPRIVRIGQSSFEGILIIFNSSQSGTLNIKTGDFTFRGQD